MSLPPNEPPPGFPVPQQPPPSPAYPAYPPNPPPGWAGYQPPPPPPGTNGLSIAALITGIFGLFLVAIPLAIAALRQIRRTGDNGRGMAIGALVLSGLWMVGLTVAGIVITLAVTSYAERDDNGVIVESGWMFADDLRLGDCTGDETGSDTVWKVEGVPCSEPHLGQVYGLIELADGGFPADDAFDEACQSRLENGFPEVWEDETVGYTWISPSDEGWDAGDRTLVCYTLTEEPRTGSFLD